MTESIKLTENDLIDVDESQYSGWVVKLSENEKEAENKLRQILENHEIIEKRFDYLKCLQSEDMSAEAFQEYRILKEILGERNE